MFPNCIDRFGRQTNKKNKIKTKTHNKKKEERKTKKKLNGNNSTYHEPLSEEWIGRKS